MFTKIKLFASLLVPIMLLSGCSNDAASDFSHNDLTNSVNLTIQTIEYGTDPLASVTLVQNSENYSIDSANPKWINTAETGTTQVNYRVSTDDQTANIIKEVTVKDTQPPIITFNEIKDVVSIDDFELEGVVKSVIDPVDGALKKVDKAPQTDNNGKYEYGWYTIKSNIPSETKKNETKSYSITVTACDKNGNKVSDNTTVRINAHKHQWEEMKETSTIHHDEVTGTRQVYVQDSEASTTYTTAEGYICDLCGSGFANMASITAHFKTVHNTTLGSMHYGTYQIPTYHEATGHYETQTYVITPAYDETTESITGYKCKVCGETREKDDPEVQKDLQNNAA